MGVNVIKDINDEGYTVLNVTNAYIYRKYHDSDEKPTKLLRRGWHNRNSRVIAINDCLDDLQASSTLVHEITHAHQLNRNEETRPTFPTPFPTTFDKELNAHIQQELYNIKMGINPKSPNFRTANTNINIEGIKSYLKKVYLGDNRKFTDTKSKYDVKEKIKPWLIESYSNEH